MSDFQSVRTTPVESIDELLRLVYAIGKQWEHRWSPTKMRFWFRGVDDASRPLDPSLLRSPYIDDEPDLERAEYEIGLDFRIRGRPYLRSEPRNSWEQMFLMQHYGFPTRLLDWTESLSAGAYFAARDISSTRDGAVWVLSPQWLVHKAHGRYATHIPSDHEWLKPYELCTGERRQAHENFSNLIPLPIIPDFIDTRIIAQRGRFTIHTFARGALEKLAAEDLSVAGVACFLHKILIPAQAKPAIRQLAHIFGGACEDTLFPDLEGLGRSMRWEALESKKSKSS